MKAALLTLAILMLSVVVLPLFQIPFIDKSEVPRLLMQVLFGGILLAALYHYVKKGSKAARIILTLVAGLGAVFMAALLVSAIRVPELAALYAYSMFARIAIAVLVSTEPINAIRPELPPVEPRPFTG